MNVKVGKKIIINIISGRFDIVKFLIVIGAELNTVDQFDRTPLDCAIHDRKNLENN